MISIRFFMVDTNSQCDERKLIWECCRLMRDNGIYVQFLIVSICNLVNVFLLSSHAVEL